MSSARILPVFMSRIVRWLLFGAVLLRAAIGYAQTDFRPGYIVQPAGDTVRGQRLRRPGAADGHQLSLSSPDALTWSD